MIKSVVTNPVAVRAIGLAFGNLTALWLLITWVGASRAYTVGVHTLFRDHLASVAAVLLVTFAAAVVLGWLASSTFELWQTLWFVVWTDVVAALAITLAIGEMFRHPELARAVFAETAGGTQILTIILGLAVGYLSRGRYRARS